MRYLKLIALSLALASSASAAGSQSTGRKHLGCMVEYSFDDFNKNVNTRVSVPIESPDGTISSHSIDLLGFPAKLSVFYRPSDGATAIVLTYDDGRAYLETSGSLHMQDGNYGVYLAITGAPAAAIIPGSSGVTAQCELAAE